MKKLENISLESKKKLEEINLAYREQLIDIYKRSEILYKRSLTKLSEEEIKKDIKETMSIKNELGSLGKVIKKQSNKLQDFEFDHWPFICEIDHNLSNINGFYGSLKKDNYARDFLEKVITEIRDMKIID